LLHTDPVATSYQQIATETVNGRTAQKYRVVVNSSAATNVSVNETLIWIDEALHMPIKSETTSGDGKRVTMELTGIALDVDRTVFQIPEGYEKITILDLPKRLKVSE
jgi:outer membrane lipoprotein-sorting protein